MKGWPESDFYRWLAPDASIFEVLVALANRAGFQSTMPDHVWFMIFLKNLGLQHFEDSVYCTEFARETKTSASGIQQPQVQGQRPRRHIPGSGSPTQRINDELNCGTRCAYTCKKTNITDERGNELAMDFYRIQERETKSGGIEVYPDFVVARSKDLMVRARSFYAIWDGVGSCFLQKKKNELLQF